MYINIENHYVRMKFYKSILLLLAIVCLPSQLFSQESINSYKYIIIPSEYSFLKEKDRYQLNSLTKFLFNKYGYTAFFYEDQFPDDLQSNRCLAMYADVSNEKGLFKTKIKIDLKDCNGRIVYESKVGETREKEFDKAYNLALRDAFETYQHLDYKYEPNAKITSISTQTQSADVVAVEEVQQSKAEIARLQKEIDDLKEAKEKAAKEPKVKAQPVVEAVKHTEPTISELTEVDALYAQPIANGFQVVDMKPSVVMVLLETKKQDVFIVKDQNAIVYKEDGFWYYSSNDGKTVSIKTLNIKF